MFWKPALDPSSWHGITTVLMGNCSISLAPCNPEDQDFLALVMAVVEDIPGEAIRNELPWTWTSYGEYLQAVEATHPVINVAGLTAQIARKYRNPR